MDLFLRLNQAGKKRKFRVSKAAGCRSGSKRRPKSRKVSLVGSGNFRICKRHVGREIRKKADPENKC